MLGVINGTDYADGSIDSLSRHLGSSLKRLMTAMLLEPFSENDFRVHGLDGDDVMLAGAQTIETGTASFFPAMVLLLVFGAAMGMKILIAALVLNLLILILMLANWQWRE